MKSSYKSADQVSIALFRINISGIFQFLSYYLPLQFQVNSLREIQAIKRLAPHQNIVKLEEVLFDPPSGRLALVFELLEGNLYELMKGNHQQFDLCNL